MYRYDVTKSDDGVGGEEGTFCLCTLWSVQKSTWSGFRLTSFCRTIEALARAGEYDKGMLAKAVGMFEVR